MQFEKPGAMYFEMILDVFTFKEKRNNNIPRLLARRRTINTTRLLLLHALCNKKAIIKYFYIVTISIKC